MEWNSALKDIGSRLAGRLFPGICLCCGLDSGRNIDICEGCEAALVRPEHGCYRCGEPMTVSAVCGHCLADPPAFATIHSGFLYEPPVDGLILSLKRGGDLVAGRLLGTLLAESIGDSAIGLPDVIVAMPLHWRRRLVRGFNQARELALPLSRHFGIPLADNLLRRVRHTPPQQSFRRGNRLANLRRSFAAKPACAGLHIALVDDVVTTGATARAAAAALVAAGASRVEIWSVARTALEN